MSLKYKLISVPNEEFNPKKLKYLQRIAAKFKGMNKDFIKLEEDDEEADVPDENPFTIRPIQWEARHIVTVNAEPGFIQGVDNRENNAELAKEINKVKELVQKYRRSVKNYSDIPSVHKMIHITSDKEWEVYEENIDEETGRTVYGPKETLKVDRKVTYNRNAGTNLKEVIKHHQDEALYELKSFRDKRKQIGTIEKDYTPAALRGLPIQPRYEVSVGGGLGGPSCKVTYKDKWRDYGDFSYDVSEVNNNYNIHLKGGTFLELQKATLMRRIFEPKVPMTNDNHVGVEIEFISKFDKYKLAQFLLREDVQQFVYLTEDGSLRTEDDYTNPHEITVLAPERMIGLVLERVMKAINTDKGSKVNWRCGLHVHLDMRNRNKELAFHNFVKAQRIMFAMNPRSRLDGTRADGRKDEVYSRRFDTTDWEEAIKESIAYGEKMAREKHNGVDYSRYFGVNPRAFERHKTIEIRIHSGSTNFEKINNWVNILVAIVNKTTKVHTEYAKPETFCENFGLNETMLNYIKERINKFKDKDGKHITVEEVA